VECGFIADVMRQKSLYFVCHSGLDEACPVLNTGESSVSELDSRLGGNDGLRNNVKKCWTHYNSCCPAKVEPCFLPSA
jgi:hypothetical protein